MHKISTLICSALLCLVFTGAALAVKPIYSGGKERAAIRGYDVVAYFTENAPVKGSPQYSLDDAGATWFFSYQANLEVFKANPDKYMPQYGGYCAYAVARNSTASIKPEYFTIHDGKLYLNYSKSVFKRWNKNKEQYISDADQKWPKLLNK
jgi:YHS domain-containing protein